MALWSNTVASRLTPELARAWIPVPSALFRRMKDLELRPSELVFLLFALDGRRSEREPIVSLTQVSAKTGVSTKTLGRATQRLDQLGLIRKRSSGSRRDRSRNYDIRPLLFRLEDLQQEMFDEEPPDQADRRFLNGVWRQLKSAMETSGIPSSQIAERLGIGEDELAVQLAKPRNPNVLHLVALAQAAELEVQISFTPHEELF